MLKVNEDSLRLIVMNNAKYLGEKVGVHLFKDNSEKYLVPNDEVRFSNGEGKVVLLDSVRNKDVFILSDVGNYGQFYNIYGNKSYMRPDEHFQDIKRVISAIRGNASRINLITPLLYESRQHRRNGRESLDCAIALKELESMGVNNIITFDAHDPNVQNAIPLLPFDNLFPTNSILDEFITREEIDYEKLLVIAPDAGAVKRAQYYSGMLHADIAMFYKRRDYSKVVNGQNPVVEHKYLGKEEDDLSYIIVDDMIASGGSMLDIFEQLSTKKPQGIYAIATFAFFTNGTEKFDEAYKNGLLNKVYTTNLSYIPDKIKDKPWLVVVDCSKNIAEAIQTIHNGESMSPLMNGKKEIYQKIMEKRK